MQASIISAITQDINFVKIILSTFYANRQKFGSSENACTIRVVQTMRQNAKNPVMK
jgi:hypothetical protein